MCQIFIKTTNYPVIIEAIVKGGGVMSIWKRIKNGVSRYLERLAKENQEMFGSGRPDCCALNRKQMSQRTPETHKK